MRVGYGDSAKTILEALGELGPMTRAELEHIVREEVKSKCISPIISRLHKDTPRMGKQISIVGYVYDAEGGRRYPRAIYALGAQPDVSKPKPSHKENRRRYDAKKKAMFSKNSVFNLAKTRDQIREERRMAA
jgi:hypothetical protein